MVEKSTVLSLASVLLLGVGTSAQVVFPASDVSGAFASTNGADLTLPSTRSSGGKTVITRPDVTKKGTLQRLCGCSDDQPVIGDIRKMSNDFFADGVRPSSHSFSNLVWAWGQFIDHDIVATIDGTDDDFPADEIELYNGRGMRAIMRLHPLISDGGPSCSNGGGPRPAVVNSPLVDAGTVYSDEDYFLQNVLRVGADSCMLRTSGPENMLPISSIRNSENHYVFVAGDARVDEHAVLTMMHTIWMREHNRLCDYMNKSSKHGHMTPEQKFNKARNVVIAKIQDITVREWLPLLGITEYDLRHANPLKEDKPDISVEFSTAAYRFGHDMVPDTLGPHLTVELFNGNAFFGIQETGEGSMTATHKLDDIAMFTAQSRANEVDGLFSDTLRNTLFGEFGEDLASRNIYRSRDMRLVDYGDLADCFKVNITTSIAKRAVPFMGLLRDNKFRSRDVFGPVQRAILIEQFHRIFFGAKGDWWEKRMSDVSGFESEIHDATIGSVINANTRSFVQANAFKLGFGGTKRAPYKDGTKPDDDGADYQDGGEFGFGFPDFPDHFPEF